MDLTPWKPKNKMIRRILHGTTNAHNIVTNRIADPQLYHETKRRQPLHVEGTVHLSLQDLSTDSGKDTPFSDL